MNNENLNQDQIIDNLNELGETGSAKISKGGLYVRREENTDWQFCGTVENTEEAQEVIDNYYR